MECDLLGLQHLLRFPGLGHRPYRAQTKGKVESGVRYVKRFVRGKAFESMAHLNTLLGRWLATVADLRIHGTTHQRPIDLFEQERTLLLPTGAKPLPGPGTCRALCGPGLHGKF